MLGCRCFDIAHLREVNCFNVLTGLRHLSPLSAASLSCRQFIMRRTLCLAKLDKFDVYSWNKYCLAANHIAACVTAQEYIKSNWGWLSVRRFSVRGLKLKHVELYLTSKPLSVETSFYGIWHSQLGQVYCKQPTVLKTSSNSGITLSAVVKM